MTHDELQGRQARTATQFHLRGLILDIVTATLAAAASATAGVATSFVMFYLFRLGATAFHNVANGVVTSTQEPPAAGPLNTMTVAVMVIGAVALGLRVGWAAGLSVNRHAGHYLQERFALLPPPFKGDGNRAY